MKSLIFLFFLIQITFTQKTILNGEVPFKPFVSVLKPETLRRYEHSSNAKQKEILPKQNGFKPFISVVSPDSMQPFTSLEGEVPSQMTEASFSVKCMYVANFSLYDIKNLGINTLQEDKGGYDSSIAIADKEKNIESATIYYNFCFDLKIDLIDVCKDDENIKDEKKQILVVENDGNNQKCLPLAKSILGGNKWTTYTKKKNETDDSETSFIKIEVNPENDTHKVYYILECADNEGVDFVPSESYYSKKNDDGTYETVLYIRSKEACVKMNFYVIWKFIMDYKAIFAAALILFGLFNCILGQKFSQFTSFLLALFAVTVLWLILSQYILPSGCATWIIWVMLAIGLILGATAGYFVFKYHKKVIAFLVGGVAGFFLGEFLFNLLGNKINWNSTVVHILFIIGCIIALIVVAFFLKDVIIIFATSFIGAYTLIRGISFFAGGFPNEFTVMDLRSRGENEQLKGLLTWKVYVYLSAIVIVTGLSIFIQYKINKGFKKREEGPECPDDNLLSSSDKDK